MIYNYDHIPIKTPMNRRSELKMTPNTITIHNTGNTKSTAKNERAWLTSPTNDRTASYHIVIDQNEAIECVPLNEVAWHAGDGITGAGNRKSIGIEICESGDYEKTLSNAVELVTDMLLQRAWGVDRLKRHFDWSGKICPRKMYDKGKWLGWTSFINRVQNAMDGVDEVELQKEIELLKEEIIKLKARDSMDVPKWATEAVDAAVKTKLVDTRDGGSFDFYRIITILHRKGFIK